VPDVSESPSRRRGVVGLAVVAVIAAVGAGLLAFVYEWEMKTLSTQAFEDTIRDWGVWGVLAALGLMVVHSFVPFPAEFVALANGMVYGHVWGTVITWTGAMLGAALAFGLARGLGRPFVARMVARKDWQAMDDWAAENGWQVILIARFIPVIAFNLINYAAGLSRLTWWQFLWTTGVGILPLTVLMVVMGDNLETFGWESWVLLFLGGALLWFVLRRRLGRRLARRPPPRSD
jgi:uncharacterized membrane protein YdjX (TVP38/TMEM64 family)